jgi:DNA topoisomerase-1
MDPGLVRKGNARTGFRYVDATDRVVRDRATLARVSALAVPPAWRDVHVARSASRAIQAWGYDARGRKQYRYHERAVAKRELRKYHRMRTLAKALPAIRSRLLDDAEHRGHARSAVAALVVRLIGETFCRIGSERYLRDNGTFGITTVRKAHLAIEQGTARIDYRGKSRVRQRQRIGDPDLVRLLAKARRTPGPRLFRYRTSDGTWRNLTADEVNRYARDHLGGFSAKEFRTWGGTLRAATVLAELGPARSPTEAKRNVAMMMRMVAAELGNTPAVCRSSYVHPIVIARYVDEGESIARRGRRPRPAGARDFTLHSDDERALIAFLDRHFPERRKTRRSDGG